MLENNILSKRFNQKSMYIDRWVNYKFTYQNRKSYHVLKNDLLAAQSFKPSKLFFFYFYLILKLYLKFDLAYHYLIYSCVIRFQIFI